MFLNIMLIMIIVHRVLMPIQLEMMVFCSQKLYKTFESKI